MKNTRKKIVSWIITIALVLGIVAIVVPEQAVQAATVTPVSTHGKLSVKGTQLVDKSGQPFQIRGVSTHGLQWYAQYNNKAAYQTLRDDWCANAVRLAMYVDEGGYYSDRNGMKQKVNDGVRYATELGMYAIIDWHLLNVNPINYTNEAKAFFAEMANKYKNYDNVIYEICNEPNNCAWSDIKNYATEVIRTIRTYDKDAIIIVGTPTWSQLGNQGHTYEPADDPIRGYSNLMYAFHFYASEPAHNQWLTAKIQTAIQKGLPVFVSEFGLSEASGDGNVDLTKAAEWMKRCDDNKVSYCVWSLSNDYRSSSLIKNSCSKTSGWTVDELTTAGQYIRNYYRSKRETTEEDNPKVKNLAKNITVSYKTHIQTYGWQNYVSNGKMSGSVGSAKRLEGIRIKVSGDANLGIRYKTHVQTYGWQDWKSNDAMSGTEGKAKRLEAICIELTGANKDKYDVYYRVHAQTYGWLDWSKNGEMAGTEGLAKRLEAINIIIVPKGADPGIETKKPFVSAYPGYVNYKTHVQTYGWESGWRADGYLSGTKGKGKRLEAIQIKLGRSINGGIAYKTHVQTYGWQNWVYNGATSGTSGQGKRLEAIQIKLTGQAAKQYDIYYRVHVQTYGWLGWAKNGQMSGTSGLAKRLEGIEIRIVKKGAPAPGTTARACIVR